MWRCVTPYCGDGDWTLGDPAALPHDLGDPYPEAKRSGDAYDGVQFMDPFGLPTAQEPHQTAILDAGRFPECRIAWLIGVEYLLDLAQQS